MMGRWGDRYQDIRITGYQEMTRQGVRSAKCGLRLRLRPRGASAPEGEPAGSERLRSAEIEILQGEEIGRWGDQESRISGNDKLRCLRLRITIAGKKWPEGFTEFLRRDHTHDLIVKFFEVVNIADIPWREDHSGAKPSIHP
jgi:hypothetical protein